MKLSTRYLVLPLLIPMILGGISCQSEKFSPEKAAFAKGEDLIMEQVISYRTETRQLYDQSNFEQLETRANEARTGKTKFENGTWKLTSFYDALDCQRDAPEATWQHQEKTYQDWEKQFPNSITARVAYADFLTQYAWHARGTGYANEVTPEAWKLYGDRMTAAKTLLEQSKSLEPKCPVWWEVMMKVAQGQSWKIEEFAKLYDEAKTFEPTYFRYDFAQAKFLMPTWYGKPGDWEAAALKDIDRPSGLGLEGYARVISEMRGYYDDIFTETKASWKKTNQGFEVLHTKYPSSAEILNAWCRLACVAGDKPTAKKLFAMIGNKTILYCWGNERKRFDQMKNWANS